MWLEQGARLFVVESGGALLVNGHGRRTVAAIAAPGDVLAPPDGLQELRPLRRASLTAVTGDALRTLLLQPPVCHVILAALVEAIADREESLANLARYPHAERVRGKFLQLARSHGNVTKNGIVIDLPLTHDLIAESVGSTRETVTLAVRDLVRAGFISRPARRYRLHLPPQEVVAGRRMTVKNPTVT